MPEVSVVIPTYERADVLPRAMESALTQTVEDLELLVVDDGSTDQTEAVVREYDDDRVRYVGHDTNRGGNVARNTGIEAAEGRYVAFLDSDDEWQPRKLEVQLERVEATDAVAAVCDAERSLGGPTGRLQAAVAGFLDRLDDDPTLEGAEDVAAAILAGSLHPAAGSTLLVETDVVRGVGGWDETLDRFQDPEIVVRLCEEGHVAYVDEPLVVRHDTGEPAPETVHEADQQYLRKHAEAVRRAEARGYDVLGTHNFLLAQHYLADGQLLTGCRLLRHGTVTPRKVPGLGLATAGGVTRRLGRAETNSVLGLAGIAGLLALSLLWWRRS